MNWQAAEVRRNQIDGVGVGDRARPCRAQVAARSKGSHWLFLLGLLVLFTAGCGGAEGENRSESTSAEANLDEDSKASQARELPAEGPEQIDIGSAPEPQASAGASSGNGNAGIANTTAGAGSGTRSGSDEPRWRSRSSARSHHYALAPREHVDESAGGSPAHAALEESAEKGEGVPSAESASEEQTEEHSRASEDRLAQAVDVFFATDRLPTEEVLPSRFRTFLPALAVGCICAAMFVGMAVARRFQIFWMIGSALGACLGVMVLHVSIIRWQEYSRLANGESTRFSVLRFEPDPSEYPLHVGLAKVTLPWNHQPGGFERPSLWKLEFSESPDKHIMLRSVDVEPRVDDWLGKISDRVRYASEREGFVFIHGYNVRFADALKRTAQLAADLRVRGPIISYSWPSRGQLTAYAADEASVSWAAPNFEKLLVDLVARTEVRKLNIVAHSMGNRALMESIERIHLRTGLEPGYVGKNKMIGSLILAAPDVDAQLFQARYVDAIRSVAERAVLYFTDEDRALQLSQRLHASPRLGLGQLPDGHGLEAVDTGSYGLFSLGHAYYGSDPVVIDDMRNVLESHLSAERRSYLRKAETESGITYWQIDRALHASLSQAKQR